MEVVDQKLDERRGGTREFTALFLPILLMNFPTYLLLFIEKVLPARVSEEAVGISTNPAHVIQVFQAPCAALAMVA